ncbi:ExeM/NucH family extracellular endonuclease [Nocardioides pantholopis]|uniref:ExeM/NucH family extracellular endonuclease n=1 Tax=Nocardioides pantholopis TaxID=2483798 RepID=UPI000FD87BB9|nr:ExeM/NucH family extracellular endonuclease [Nocardioides pantholopis]
MSLHPRQCLATVLGAAVAGLALVPGPAQADPAGSGLVISEVYGGGGATTGSPAYAADFVELYNPTDAAVPLAGLSLQYRSAAFSSTGSPSVATLTGTVPAGRHYLVQVSTGTLGPALSGVDETTATPLSMAAGSGQVLLAEGTAPVRTLGDLAGAPGLVDMVGYGTATSFEAAPTGSALSSATSAQRAAGGADTDDNGADFTRTAPTPTGSGSDGGGPDPEPVEVTIAELQGTGEATPYRDRPVVTEGVVTAAYPTGGFFGFYLQTPGTGGPSDPASRTSSDGVFVYQPRAAGPVTVGPGDRVRVSGTAGEYAGATQVNVATAAGIEVLRSGSALPEPVTGPWPATAAQKEALEGMLVHPTGEFTVTDTYATNTYGEVGLAVGDRPLVTPTQVADAQDEAAIAAVEADNAARAIVLDDGSSTSFADSFESNDYTPTRGDLTPPYLSNAEPVRVGAAARFEEPVVLTQGGSPSAPTYRLQPTRTVVGPENSTSPVSFENTRTPAPDEALLNADGRADVTVASFNVLNYFTTLGDADDDNVGDNVGDGGCRAYHDADGDGNTVRTGCDQRGAWDPQDLARQQQKIVAAINGLDADVVGLMEIENSAVVDGTADEATRSLVAALNQAAGGTVWAANPSSADLPATAEMDVITNAIIYRVDAVQRVGAARALGTLSGPGEAFDNAREPIAQAFRPVRGGAPVLVVVNHFKSKGSGVDDGTGQGNANPDRIAQAEALAAWVPTVQADLGVDPTLLIGDFNAYAMEDPLQVLSGAGYTNVELASGNEEYSYSFDGMVGSLDHALANAAALDLVTGVDVWNINSPESIALEYSRWNYHATDFHQPTPYRSSDHDPVLVGLDLVDDRRASTTAAVAIPPIARVGRTRVQVLVAVAARGRAPATGTVTASGPDGSATAPLRNGLARIALPRFTTPGLHQVEVSYSGDDATAPSTQRVSVWVLR